MRRPTPLNWFVILAVLAVGLALGLPPDPHAIHQLHTTATSFRLAIAALLIPYILIWYAAFYAFGKLVEYARHLKGTKDGEGFYKMTLGMGVLAFSLVVPAIVSLTLHRIAVHNPAFRPEATIIANYVNIFPGVAAFLLLLNGARALLRTAPGAAQRFDLRWHTAWFLLLAVVFSHLTIENQYQSNPYHLSLWILIVTIIVPYLYGWAVGLMSAYDLNVYSKAVRGSLYRRAIKQFANGIAVAILGSIAIQFTNITIGQRIDKSLSAVLLADYMLLIIIAAGLALMALGTKKLKQIEEI